MHTHVHMWDGRGRHCSAALGLLIFGLGDVEEMDQALLEGMYGARQGVPSFVDGIGR